MNSNTLSNLWLIGASPMAQDYASVLKALDTPFKVIGRGENSAIEFKTALGMSVISMLIMELAMNIVDVVTMGGAYLSLKITPVILFAGWIAAAPYNYYRLKKYNVSCH